MRKTLRPYCLAPFLLCVVWMAAAQQPPQQAPLPPGMTAAKRLFISNAGSDSGLFPHPFSGDPDRAYQQFYAAVQSWHRYRLVSDPAQADLIAELRLTAPNGPQNPNKSTGASDPLPMFRLVIYDRPTHYILWALTESIEAANLQKNHDRNFDDSLAALTEDFRRLVEPSAATP